MTIYRFESVEAYAREVSAIAEGREAKHYKGAAFGWDRCESGMGQSWDLGVRGPEAVKLAIGGDVSITPQVTKACERMKEFAIGEAPAIARVPDYYGSSVSVSAYLAGDPMCMRRRVRTRRVQQHVTMYVSTACSAGVKAEDMLKRGCAILGFLEYLQASNIGVDLYLVDDLYGRKDGDCHIVTRVESRPLDLSVSAFAIAHPAFTRKLGFTFGYAVDGFNGSWSDSFGKTGHSIKEYEPIMRRLLGMQEQDVYLPPVFLYDRLITDPDGWLKERVSQLRESSHV